MQLEVQEKIHSHHGTRDHVAVNAICIKCLDIVAQALSSEDDFESFLNVIIKNENCFDKDSPENIQKLQELINNEGQGSQLFVESKQAIKAAKGRTMEVRRINLEEKKKAFESILESAKGR